MATSATTKLDEDYKILKLPYPEKLENGETLKAVAYKPYSEMTPIQTIIPGVKISDDQVLYVFELINRSIVRDDGTDLPIDYFKNKMKNKNAMKLVSLFQEDMSAAFGKNE